MPHRQPAIFLDRDGVLNKDHGYVYKPEDLEMLPGVAPALRELQARGFALVVVSNQSGVARGYFTAADVERFHAALNDQLLAEGAPGIDRFYYCPHHPEGSVAAYRQACACRKPAPGMVLQAAADLSLDLPRSYLVGDREADIECAQRAGIRAVQVRHSGRSQHPAALGLVASLAEALPFLRHTRQ